MNSVLCRLQYLVLFAMLFIFIAVLRIKNAIEMEKEATKWFFETEAAYSDECNKYITAMWNAESNINEETHKADMEQTDRFNEFNEQIRNKILSKFPKWSEFKDMRLRRAFKHLASKKTSIMSMEMRNSYSTATVCEYHDPSNCNLRIADIEEKLKGQDLKELEYYWSSWHDKMSSVVSPDFYKYLVDHVNELARENGFNHGTEEALQSYDEETENWTYLDFEHQIIYAAEEISKLYDILHAYVRMKLRQLPEYHGIIKKCGYIPVHITGNMWAQEWTHLDNLTKPFPNAPSLDATSAMKMQGYTPLKMYQQADKFFQGMGMMKMTDQFWQNSILERPNDGREIVCHASAWDFCLGKGNTDFRIKHCAYVSQREFYVAHHEMGHIQYSQQYSNLEFPFRGNANPGFDEAIGDTFALAVLTPQHLQCKLKLDLGLGPEFCETVNTGPFDVTETDINYLFRMALEQLAFFPFGAAVDFFRFSVFEDQISPEEYNKVWWRIRQDFQGIKTPTDRASSVLFDAAAKFHVVANIDYIRYFVSRILVFQFFEAMCIAAKEFNPSDPNSKPLYQCDFSGSLEAGKLMGDMMKLGSSQPWPDALEMVTGKRKMCVDPLKRYMQPVLEYMENELKKNGEVIGFGDSCEEVEKRNGTSKWSELIGKDGRFRFSKDIEKL